MTKHQDRYSELKRLFRERKVFKFVCGAGNEDLTEVRRLTTVYSLAGAVIHDLSANISVVETAKKGIDIAYRVAGYFGTKIPVKPYLNVSIGIKGDPHVRKARIEQVNCSQCGKCNDICRQGAIEKDFTVIEYRCIGCGDCQKVCLFDAIQFVHREADFQKVLPDCAAGGVETMELHAVTEDDDAVMGNWRLLNGIIKDNFVSVCLDRSLLSNVRLVERIRMMHSIAGERMIVQADGMPMSGEGDDLNTTLQAVACADIVLKSHIPVIVLLSGGTNSKTGTLANQCGVRAHGVAVGSYAREIVRSLVMRENFDENLEVLKEAVLVAEKLVRSNIEGLHG